MIGRELETSILEAILKKNKSSFLAITGRRRIGKTYLIDAFFKKNICFRITGIQNANQQEQLNNFAIKLSEFTNTPTIAIPKSWQEAFLQLKTHLLALDKRTKRVILF